MFPAFGAYVGGDITAGLLASGMDRDSRIRLFVDIGTNCEIVLGNRDWLLATAAPAGPAFEGAAIRCGMRAADGAIEVVSMTPDGLDLQVIGDAEPAGLCGSGLVDAVASLVSAGAAGSLRPARPRAGRGAALAPGLAARLTQLGQERVFVLHWLGEPGDVAQSIYLSQRDVRELQFAKAAIATGWRILLEEAGLAAGRHPAGAAGRVVRQLPVAGQRDPARPGAQAAGAAGGQRRQRGRRGRQDGAALGARAGRRPWRCWRR